jgi:hypothetical protein
MEDALISPAGFMILSGAGLVEANGAVTAVKNIAFDDGDIKFTVTDGTSAETKKITVYSKIALKEPFSFTFTNGKKGTFVLDSNKRDLVADPQLATGEYVFVAVGQVDASDDIIGECFTGTGDDTTYNGTLTVKALTTSAGTTLKVHTTEQVEVNEDGVIYTSKKPYIHGTDNLIYVMVLDANGEISTEPYLYSYVEGTEVEGLGFPLVLKTTDGYLADASKPTAGNIVLVDYYVEKESHAQQIEITADKFGGNYYLEASTLFRNTSGKDMPAEFIIPNCKIQSNFTFTMASSGDPSTFTFTMDAFPDYTRFDNTKKVLAAIQIISATSTEEELKRPRTQTTDIEDPTSGLIVRPAVASE